VVVKRGNLEKKAKVCLNISSLSTGFWTIRVPDFAERLFIETALFPYIYNCAFLFKKNDEVYSRVDNLINGRNMQKPVMGICQTNYRYRMKFDK